MWSDIFCGVNENPFVLFSEDFLDSHVLFLWTHVVHACNTTEWKKNTKSHIFLHFWCDFVRS